MDRIIRGARPAELPVEQPTTFELVGIGIDGRRHGHVEIKRFEVAGQPLQQLETIIAPPASVGQKHERLQLAA